MQINWQYDLPEGELIQKFLPGGCAGEYFDEDGGQLLADLPRSRWKRSVPQNMYFVGMSKKIHLKSIKQNIWRQACAELSWHSDPDHRSGPVHSWRFSINRQQGPVWVLLPAYKVNSHIFAKALTY